MSPNNKYLAFGEAFSGKDISTIRFLDIENGIILDDMIEDIPSAL